MAAQRGLEMLFKVDSDGAGTYTTIAGGQTMSLRIDKDNVDVTSQDDTSRWRQLLANAGVKSLAATIRGTFKDSAPENTALTYILADTQRSWKVVVPALGTFTFPASIGPIEYSGEHAGEVQYNITLESAGDVGFA